jgi:hypothetical protein
MPSEVADGAQKAASAVMYGGAAVSSGSWGANYFGLSKDEWTLIFGAIGALMAIGGFVLTWYYKHQHFKLALTKAVSDLEE